MMRIGIGTVFSAFLALDSLSKGAFAQNVIQAVEYTFDEVVNNGTVVVNTGIGDPSPSSSLDGTIVGRGITFDGNGRDGSAAAKFRGNGCIQVPDSIDVNLSPLRGGSMRMITLDFKWDGTLDYGTNAYVLYEEGGRNGRLNIYLARIRFGKSARLFMAVWKADPTFPKLTVRSTVIHTELKAIKDDTWYTATMMLDANVGTLTGYLDDKRFQEREVDFLPLPNAGNKNCLGGMKDGTVIWGAEKGDDVTEYGANNDGLYFKGQIDNFAIRNEAPVATRPVLEYAFRKNGRHKNTGTGSNLDGASRPKERRNTNINNGISFKYIGASFTGRGCIQVPDSDDVNESPVSDRTIVFDFKWDGIGSVGQTQILFEEGGSSEGINIYLSPKARRASIKRKAVLVMAVWETSPTHGVQSEIVSTTVWESTWYHASLVLDRFGNLFGGTLTGYLDSVPFGQTDVDFFPINAHGNDNCIGGMLGRSRVFSTLSDASFAQDGDYGLFFYGLINTFRLFNKAIHPVIPTASPSESPSASPSTSLHPTASPSEPPSTAPSKSLVPTASASPSSSSSSLSMSPPPSILLTDSQEANLLVEYTFNDAQARSRNTGSASTDLDGILFPQVNNGIRFHNDIAGRDGTVAPTFTGKGCIRIPFSNDVYLARSGIRMVSLDFRWDGDRSGKGIPQVLYEEGDRDGPLNIYLDRISTGRGTAKLFMAVWKAPHPFESRVIHTSKKTVQKKTWYTATMVLDVVAGTLSGYLDDEKFGEETVDFFPLGRSSGDKSCLGGMKEETVIFESDKDGDFTRYDRDDGLYFSGQIDNFRVRKLQEVHRASPVLEYTFDDNTIPQISLLDPTFDIDTKRYKNTGYGSGLNGMPFPEKNHGITFSNLAAMFSRSGCIQVPTSVHVNVPSTGVSDRTIALDFMWRGTSSNERDPQVLWEEGGPPQGINIYLDPIGTHAAELVLAAWETNEGVLVGASASHSISAYTFYSTSLVLDQFGNSAYGTLTGYLDGTEFEQADIDFFPINAHGSANSLGGMKSGTRVFSTGGSGASEGKYGDGLFFNGHIDNFQLFNHVQRPTQFIFAVQYTFDEGQGWTKNTGGGRNLDGILFPETGNDITFPVGEGRDGTIVALFTGSGCIQIPDSVDVNQHQLRNREVSLDFSWDGTWSPEHPNRPLVLYEEGGSTKGFNIYLHKSNQGDTAELFMAMWQSATTTNPLHRVVRSRSRHIEANKWHHASLVLAGATSFSGYVDGFQFGAATLGFIPTGGRSDTCLGGMKGATRVFDHSNTTTRGYSMDFGLGFRGRIDNFSIRNSLPPLASQSEASPPTSPTLTPTVMPTTAPAPSPTQLPSAFPSLDPTSKPSKAPTHIPSNASSASPAPLPTGVPTERPTPLLTQAPSTSPMLHPSDNPSNALSASPTPVPTGMPTKRPTPLSTQAPSTWPTLYPSYNPSDAPSSPPTPLPTGVPTKRPTPIPTLTPSMSPSFEPTTLMPSIFLSTLPSDEPSLPPSLEPSPSPSSMPSESTTELLSLPGAATVEGNWTNITYDDFEIYNILDQQQSGSGWGSFEDGDSDNDASMRVTIYDYSTQYERFIHQGSAAIRVSRYGPSSLFYQPEDHNVTGYSKLQVHFWYYPRGLEQDEGFLLEYSSNSGANWNLVKAFVKGQDFENGSFHSATVDFDSTSISQARLRFQCAASGGRDQVFFDEVSLQGFVETTLY